MVPVDADLVIATNFPSYFVAHPRKVVWLFHQHRAAYDGVGGPWSDFGLDDDSLEAQRLLTDWDTRVLGEARRLFSTSGVVAARLGALQRPRPPSRSTTRRRCSTALRPGPFGDTVFCATRLEGNKRPELMVEALAHSTSGTRIAIAGRGSLHDDLVATASNSA